ncbi:MAG: DUF1573 domain-containing protein [Bacteroidia bacterium]|nr:DUF1573 domain-containing protein [Bacteroidia bacterium]
MKINIYNILIITSLLIITSSCTNRRSPGNSVSQENKSLEKKAPGKIVFDKEIHNFGTLKDGEIVSYSFVFRNTGGSPFNIIKADKSCGCIDIKYSTSKILPGESSVIEIVFNTAGEWGNQIKSVTIETSDSEQRELQIGAYIENKQFNNLLNTQK